MNSQIEEKILRISTFARSRYTPLRSPSTRTWNCSDLCQSFVHCSSSVQCLWRECHGSASGCSTGPRARPSRPSEMVSRHTWEAPAVPDLYYGMGGIFTGRKKPLTRRICTRSNATRPTPDVQYGLSATSMGRDLGQHRTHTPNSQTRNLRLTWSNDVNSWEEYCTRISECLSTPFTSPTFRGKLSLFDAHNFIFFCNPWRHPDNSLPQGHLKYVCTHVVYKINLWPYLNG